MAFVLVAEPSAPIAAALKRFLESARHEVQVAQSLDEVVLVTTRRRPDLVIASASGTFDGEVACGRLATLAPQVPVVLVYPPEEERPDARADQAGAASYLVGPLKRPMVLALVEALTALGRAAAELGPLRAQAAQLHAAATSAQASEKQARAEVSAWQEEARRHGEAIRELELKLASTSGASAEQEFLKRFLTLEVKRSRRYDYPVSVLFVALDAMGRPADLLVVANKSVRDVDVVMPFGDDRVLVLLPHTGRSGALVVASRLVAAITPASVGCTGSVGVAVFDPRTSPDKEKVSFGNLMREAGQSLARAQSEGGGRTAIGEAPQPKRRDRISMG